MSGSISGRVGTYEWDSFDTDVGFPTILAVEKADSVQKPASENIARDPVILSHAVETLVSWRRKGIEDEDQRTRGTLLYKAPDVYDDGNTPVSPVSEVERYDDEWGGEQTR